VEICNEFGSMSKFGSEDPGSFFVSALIPCPSDRYNSLQALCQLSILESRISEISNSSSSLTMIGGVGVESDRELDSELLVPTLRREDWVYSMETVWKSESDRMGARECKDFIRTKEFIR